MEGERRDKSDPESRLTDVESKFRFDVGLGNPTQGALLTTAEAENGVNETL